MAQINLGRVAYVNKGTYSNTTVYTKYDVVLYNNGSYVYWNGTDASGHLPTDTNYWRVMLDPTLLNLAIDNANGATTAANNAATAANAAAASANTAAANEDKFVKLHGAEIDNTTQTIVFGSDGSVSQILHKSGNTTIRTDEFTITNTTITETRTLNTGEKLTITTTLATLATTVTLTE